MKSSHIPNESFSDYKFHALIRQENDGSVTARSEEMDIVAGASSEEEACLQLAKAIIDYSREFSTDFSRYSNMPGGREKIPYVVKAILLGCPENIIPEMVFRPDSHRHQTSP
ncbi:MAG: hypothetical protein IJI20_04200 [Firmicutes bacterium]|nr:hypothetical protein [Bacillota bacterium]